MKNLAFIPARGGSKSIKLKNIKPFCGKPLLYWTCKELQESNEIDVIVIATENEVIEKTVLSFNFSKIKVYKRSQENAQDTSSTEDVILEYIRNDNIHHETNFILVQATNPFLKSNEINSAIDNFETKNYDSLLSCARMKRFFWTSEGKAINYDFLKRPRRQDFDGILVENGSFYISKVSSILEYRNRLNGRIGIFEMPEYTYVELDEEYDWAMAEHIFRKYCWSEENASDQIKLFLSDVDGVLTDAGMYYSELGDELKKYSTYDGVGFRLLKEKNIKTGIVTSENRKLNEKRAKKLKLDYIFQGAENKLEIVKELCEKLAISLNNVAFIGDDINDYDLLQNVGLAACPSNAVKKIKEIPGIIHLETEGGNGAVREFSDLILKKYYKS